MQLTVGTIYNGTEEIANAENFPKIRVFTAALKPSATSLEELLGISLNWSVASSKSVGGPDWDYISAVC
jgi:sialate O-acetylesterase